MEQKHILKILRKLLDNFIVPKFEDIYEYDLIPQIDIDGDKFIIEFWMDGTEQEVEEAIVDECHNLLKYYGEPNLSIKFKFTTNGVDFYEYD
jgi:hypothetical protein